jgi:uncharacterized protein YbcC (UPF0753/DUF2309 family)
MGNIVERVWERKAEGLLALGAGWAGYQLYREWQNRKVLTEVLRTSLKIKETGLRDFENALNQVYLKEQVEHHSIRNTAEHPIYKIAITGGPCGGKSTSLARIR